MIAVKKKAKKSKTPTDEAAELTESVVPKKKVKPEKKAPKAAAKKETEAEAVNTKAIVETRVLKEKNKEKNYEKSTKVRN